MYTITLQPQGQQVTSDADQPLLDCLQNHGIPVNSPCGKNSTCGKCTIQIVTGEVQPPTPEEEQHFSKQELAENFRLSCQLMPSGNITIKLPSPKHETKSILRGRQLPDIINNPAISKRLISGSASHQRQETAVYLYDQLLGIEEGNTCNNRYGLAIDIGTSTVVASLIDLNSGEELDCATAINPQGVHGQDVLSRISFVRKQNDGLQILHQTLIDCINRLIIKLCRATGMQQDELYDITVAANTTMLHLLLGINPSSMGRTPYLPVFTESKNLNASELTLQVSSLARIHCLPSVSSFIGADIVAGVALCRLHEATKKILFIDIGTNGEIVFSNRGDLYACSCAAGPALEGMNIRCGMLAGSGSIENVVFSENDIELNVIGDTVPKGLCGSGIIDAVSEAVRVGLITRTGRLKERSDCEADPALRQLARFVAEKDGKRILLIHEAENIYLTQADIRQVQLAKGAILSGIQALANIHDIPVNELDEIIISGQFGSCLHPESLTGINLLPKETLGKLRYIGNSSHTGALLALSSHTSRKEMEKIAEKIEYVELSLLTDYERLLASCMGF